MEVVKVGVVYLSLRHLLTASIRGPFTEGHGFGVLDFLQLRRALVVLGLIVKEDVSIKITVVVVRVVGVLVARSPVEDGINMRLNYLIKS